MFKLDLQTFAEESGVEEVPVAGEQSEKVEEVTEQTEESGVENVPAAEEPEIKDEKDFSAALKAREEQIRKQLEDEYKQYETQAQMLDRVAKFYGFHSHDEFQKAFEEAEQSRQIEQEAAKLGVDEEVIRNHLQPLNEKLQTYEAKVKELEQQEAIRKIEHEMQTLESKYEDFKDYKDRVIETAIEKGYRLEDAYILVTHQDKLANIGKETEQQVLARITGRDEKQVLPSNDRAGEINLDPSKMSLKEIEELSARVQRGETITL